LKCRQIFLNKLIVIKIENIESSITTGKEA